MANKLGEATQQQYDKKNANATTTTTTTAAATEASPYGFGNGNELTNNSNSNCTNYNDNCDERTVKSQRKVDKKNTEICTKKMLAQFKLNDLVADLCGPRVLKTGDCSAMRSNNGSSNVFPDFTNYNCNNGIVNTTTAINSSTTTTTSSTSSFSFKHFLSNSSRDMTAPSSTVTSLDPVINSANQIVNGDAVEKTAYNSNCNNSLNAIADPNKPYQTSTGTRPKIPQSNSVCTTSICTLMSNARISDSCVADNSYHSYSSGASGKMKRSPRFSSFDSQASLAEYAGLSGPNSSAIFECDLATTTGFSSARNKDAISSAHLFTDELTTSDLFTTTNNSSNSDTAGSIDLMQKYVPRSHSNYEMPPTVLPRRRVGVYSMENNTDQKVDSVFGCYNSNNTKTPVSCKEARPTRLALNAANGSGSKFKLDLHLDDMSKQTSNEHNVIDTSGSNVCAAGDIAPATAAATAAALPDFVQDHWLEAWHVQENMRLIPPTTSPAAGDGSAYVKKTTTGDGGSISNFRGRLAPAKLTLGNSAYGSSNLCDVVGDKAGGNGNAATINSSLSQAMDQQHESNNETLNLDLGCNESGIVVDETMQSSNTAGSKMLPDFLADGPIIHSAQRLADVAAGLPANSVGSPEEPPITSQLLNLRHDNEQLQRELNDVRMALNEQTCRANQLERQLQEQHHCNSKKHKTADASTITTNSYNKNNKEEENATNSCSIAESEIVALRMHVTDLTLELEKLRRENAILCEGGAMGGVTATRSQYMGQTHRNQHQISRDLFRAATKAENNLRQLLTGVENLRQMANEIENTDFRAEHSNDISPDLYPDFYDDCDDTYDEYRSGPA